MLKTVFLNYTEYIAGPECYSAARILMAAGPLAAGAGAFDGFTKL